MSMIDCNNIPTNSELYNRFAEYKSKHIAVYGLGENSRVIFDVLYDYDIVALVANDHIGEEKYGMKIQSIEVAAEMSDVIIIAASFAATSIILSRIKNIIPKDMPILNMLGERLITTNDFEDNHFWQEEYRNLLDEIDKHDVISFDVFDTLIMRNLLEAKDVFYVVAERIGRPQFVDYRIDSEKRSRRLNAEPTISDFYMLMKNENLILSGSYDDVQKLELSVEYEHIVARDTVLNAFGYALLKGKKVFLTSDMYLRKEEMAELLRKCGVNGEYELLVSCEYGCSKIDGELFEILKEKAEKPNILHIGDDELVDKINAEKEGIHSYLIKSSYKMLAMSSCVFLFDFVKSFDDKCYLGFYNSVVLNDPFVLYHMNGRIRISSEKDVAILTFPITKLFLDYIINNASDYDCLLFPSRDGFFIYELYCNYRKMHPEINLPEAKYIYSSRMSLSRVALKDNDSFDVLIHKLLGNLSKNCKKYIDDLFGIELPKEFDCSCYELISKYGKNTLIDRLHRYVPSMVDALSEVSEQYNDYIKTQGLIFYSKIALVDIVSYGTQPYCLSKILGKPVDMISIGSSGVPNVFMTEDRVHSLYGNVNEEVNDSLVNLSDLSVLHLVLEVIYSSRDGQFVEISRTGKPIMLEGSEYDSSLLDGVQSELIKLFEEYGKKDDISCSFSPEFSHAMLRTLRSKYSILSDELKQKFSFSDPYDGGFATVNITDFL